MVRVGEKHKKQAKQAKQGRLVDFSAKARLIEHFQVSFPIIESYYLDKLILKHAKVSLKHNWARKLGKQAGFIKVLVKDILR